MLKSVKRIAQGVLKQRFRKFYGLFCVSAVLLFSCASSKTRRLEKQVVSTLNDAFYNEQFTGFFAVDLQKKDTLIDINSSKYFTPASNVKIFTFYAASKVLPQNIPTLKYLNQNDTLFIAPTGDPSWLHPYFKDSTALQFLKGSKTIALDFNSFQEEAFGPGWAWEDYEYYYSPERSAFPLYGNVVTVFKPDAYDVAPNYFKNSIAYTNGKPLRSLDTNSFRVSPTLTDTLEIPFLTGHKLTKTLLQEKLDAIIATASKHPETKKEVLYGIKTDSIYRRMLYESDNFLAEQLMLVTASTLSDTLNFNIAKDHILKDYLSDLRQPPRWVDGSGLSRYNLFTPEAMVHVLTKLWTETPQSRLLHLFPNWNAEGTIALEKEQQTPSFIYAKSGGMGNVYNLSGYLKTKSGKFVAFSFMNNHFRKPSGVVRQKMYTLLQMVHNTY